MTPNSRSYINRFIQPDTLVPNPADPQSWNRFAYALNNPLRYTDPTGHYVDEGCGSGDGNLCELPESEPPHPGGGNDPNNNGSPPSLEEIISYISPDAIFWPTYTMFSLYGRSQGWNTDYFGPFFIPVGDGTFLVIMPPGQNPTVERNRFLQVSSGLLSQGVGASFDMIELALLIEPTPVIPETIVAGFDLFIAGVASYMNGQSYLNNTPNSALPRMDVSIGQDVLVTGTDLIAGLAGPIPDAITTSASVFYDAHAPQNRSFINIAFPQNTSETWIVFWPFPTR